MHIDSERLPELLRKGLAPVYLVSGDEPLLVDESCEEIRDAARGAGYSERSVANVASGFDWNDLFVSTQSLSLFSSARLLEVRMPNGKPGERGAQVLSQLGARPPADSILLVVTGKLDRQTRESGWVKSLEEAGVAVTVRPLDAERLPGWVTRRMRLRGLRAEPGVADIIAYRMEGNPLAAAQEVDKLALLYGDGEIRIAEVEGILSNNARFTVYGLADACLAGDGRSAIRVLESLRAEGLEPILVLWALARETRSMAQIAAQIAQGHAESGVFQAHRIWASRRPVVSKALRRLHPTQWLGMLVRAAHIDHVIKGRAEGDVWLELESMVLALCGVRIHAAAGLVPRAP
ncbi:MAG: DNA polymerase III subunit delta [Gammaproteobacteria bacterium]|nr:DNA polymerase III subunit delta [Gammaproteobacteria bacterium]